MKAMNALVGVTVSNLNTEFKNVRNHFFPKWDKAGLWKCRLSRDPARDVCEGYCDDRKKVIYFNGRVKEKDLRLLLIHEICHAVMGAPSALHAAGWQRRMLQAAATAERFDEQTLAESLRAQVAAYQENSELLLKAPAAMGSHLNI